MKRKIAVMGAIALAFLLLGTSAYALGFDLVYEFDGSLPVQSYGRVNVTENSGSLDFVISANIDTLGPNADIHEFYFNLIDSFTNLSITNSSAPNPFTLLEPNPSVAGGAGASFEWGVNFGNGGGPPGNGILQNASFTLGANEPLSVASLLEFSDPNNTPPVYVAVHFQGTSTQAGSETVGGNANPVPEPATWLLIGAGLAGLAGLGRRKIRK